MTDDEPSSAASRDAAFMREALREAARGAGRTAPNPLVGCVIVKEDQIIARGYHAKSGCAHAEAAALAQARANGHNVQGATVYVTLEPCAHHGQTPPCAHALRDAKVQRVVAGIIDPDPRVQGRGMQILQDAGIETLVGVLENDCRQLNEAFITRIRYKRPHITLKLAASLDGHIATRTGDSQWLTCEQSRERVHQLRNLSDAILIGRGTAQHDNPRLTTRLPQLPDARSPHRYVVDSQLQLEPTGHLFDTTLAPTTIVCVDNAPHAKQAAIERTGATVLRVAANTDGQVSLGALMDALYARGHMRLMVEGGSELAGALVDAHLVDRLMLFLAPLLIGGRDAKELVAGTGVSMVHQARRATDMRTESIEQDLLIHAVFDASFHA